MSVKNHSTKIGNSSTLLILTEDPATWHNQQIAKAAKQYDISVLTSSITRFTGRIGFSNPVKVGTLDALQDFDGAILVRFIPKGSLEQIIFRLDFLRRIERLGIPVINSARSIEQATDKYYTTTLLEESGISTPRTIVCENARDAMRAFEDLGGDVVYKPLFGSQGLGISRISDPNIAYQIFQNLELIGSIYYLQEFIEHEKTDYRLFVIANQVVAGMRRKGDSWKTNVARGAIPELIKVDKKMAELAIKASKILKCHYAGVDIIASKEGLMVIELNTIPAWKGLQSISSTNIAEKLIHSLMPIYKKSQVGDT